MEINLQYNSANISQANEKMKRLTIDVPASLHRALKMKAVSEGLTMADMVRT